ncbi:hydroxyisourate hydrolase [Zavarzinia compransoris]|uniref:hydroxyisourate hydrolase n=1 Tax=Zavarzinia compransoris TaxID=1264899 RepID=UPI003CC816BA
MTTHILDAAHGRPAKGVTVDLYRLTGDGPRLLTTIVTNDDGRADAPILAGADFVPGTYQLDFHIGDYFRGLGLALPEPAFLDLVPIRFGIADAGAHYHVPLLASPFSFSTYRGS